MAKTEVYGAKHCRYTTELLEELEWRGEDFVYFDVEEDGAALKRMLELTRQRTVPVLVEDDEVKEIGYKGRSCAV